MLSETEGFRCQCSEFLFRSDWTLAARSGARVKIHESNVILVNLHTRLQNSGFVVVLVLVLVLDPIGTGLHSIFFDCENEDDDEDETHSNLPIPFNRPIPGYFCNV